MMRRTPMKPGKGFKKMRTTYAHNDPDRVRPTPTVSEQFRQAERIEGCAEPIVKKDAISHEPYRRLVASLPCIHCGRPERSQAAHPPPEGKGIKEDDRLCFPLCASEPGAHGCHYRFDQYKLLPTEEMRPAAREWGRITRHTIRELGLWPRTLPEWKEADDGE